MNCAELFSRQAKNNEKKNAVVTADGEAVNFGDLARRAGGIQAHLTSLQLTTEDKALVMALPCPALYASALAMMGLGISIVFVEPWMPLANIEQVVKITQPKIFVANLMGLAWGARVKAIRAIKNWVTLSSLKKNIKDGDFNPVNVAPDLPGIITFTTGTTGLPKGVVRTQGYLVNQHEVLTKSLGLKDDQGCDLTIFANFVFSNLARGCTSLLMPSTWSEGNFWRIEAQAAIHKPSTTTCGPAFLLNAIKLANFPHLDHIHVGGALTDCDIFLSAFKKWPNAHFLHVYGSSEAEPVACIDARESVEKSKLAGFFQALLLGAPVEEAKLSLAENSLWVSGRHVCPQYVGNQRENQLYKKFDEHGVLWHDMGDRVSMTEAGLWYQGRSSQASEDFLLEQKLYSETQSSKSFIRRDSNNRIVWLGEDIAKMTKIALRFKEVDDIVKTKIVRDRRHRARIDRTRSTPKHLR